MAYTKAGMKAVDKYVRENYDRIGIKVPKGCKVAIEEHAAGKSMSVNSLINKLLREDMGITEEQWKHGMEDEGEA